MSNNITSLVQSEMSSFDTSGTFANESARNIDVLLSVRNLTVKSYHNVILEDVSFNLRKGVTLGGELERVLIAWAIADKPDVWKRLANLNKSTGDLSKAFELGEF